MLALYRAALADADYVIVPREPTAEQLLAAHRATAGRVDARQNRAVYRAMIDAAQNTDPSAIAIPSQPSQK